MWWLIFSFTVKTFAHALVPGYIFMTQKEEKDPRNHRNLSSIVPVFLFQICHHFPIGDHLT